MSQLARQISINDAVSILENAIDMIVDLHGSIGIEYEDRCLIPQEVTEVARIAMQHFFMIDYTQESEHISVCMTQRG